MSSGQGDFDFINQTCGPEKCVEPKNAINTLPEGLIKGQEALQGPLDLTSITCLKENKRLAINAIDSV